MLWTTVHDPITNALYGSSLSFLVIHWQKLWSVPGTFFGTDSETFNLLLKKQSMA